MIDVSRKEVVCSVVLILKCILHFCYRRSLSYEGRRTVTIYLRLSQSVIAYFMIIAAVLSKSINNWCVYDRNSHLNTMKLLLIDYRAYSR